MWAKLREKIELEDSTPLVDEVFLECTQRTATVDEETIRTTTEMFRRMTTSNVKKLSKRKRVAVLTRFRLGVMP